MTTINQISISGNNLNIFYKGGNPGPQPSASGTCVPTSTHPTINCKELCSPISAFCASEKKCNKECCNSIYGSGFCEWKPGNPCLENPCKNGGICKANTETGTFTCACKGCYKGTTCETVNCLSGCIGGEGCEAIKGSSSCECKCNKNCYVMDESKKCQIRDCGECKGGICVCENGILKCNKFPPLDKYLVGYYCPTCTSALNLNEQDLLSTKYNVIPLAFINFNKEGILNLQTATNNCWGPKNPDEANTTNVCPKKDIINKLKNKGTIVIGSIGGSGGGAIEISNISPTYISNFVTSAIKIINDNNLDGIDFDIEHRCLTEPCSSAEYETIGLTVREIARQIKSKGYIVTAAPQCSNIGKCTGEAMSPEITGGWNELASAFGSPSKSVTSHGITFDKDLLEPNPFWLVFPQMYNAGSGVEKVGSISKYWEKMTTTGFVQKGTLVQNLDYTVKFDTTNFIVGVPASKKAASSGYNDPEILIKDLLEPNLNLRGLMTWDIGWDFTNKWNFNKTIGNYLFPS